MYKTLTAIALVALLAGCIEQGIQKIDNVTGTTHEQRCDEYRAAHEIAKLLGKDTAEGELALQVACPE